MGRIGNNWMGEGGGRKTSCGGQKGKTRLSASERGARKGKKHLPASYTVKEHLNAYVIETRIMGGAGLPTYRKEVGG